ncbi:uncharacterized protein PAC_17920 [Phialocephala subalpina]|uniref:homogentisate 1,2-dioxygenase n=1 Tax=Phialocephala subalpina TaxID=576137 RepID=A0A1L7XSK4_9HELO|nr:uncharacterized protein PAC_17920 [Phialocephala subalpina]
MESVAKEFSRSRVSAPSSNRFDAGPDPNTILNAERTSLDPSSELVFEEDGFINALAILPSENGQLALTLFEPHLNHNAAILVDNDLEVEYTGTVFSLIVFLKLTFKVRFAPSPSKVSDGSVTWLVMIVLVGRCLPNQLRWDPFDLDLNRDWVESPRLVCGAGAPSMKNGLGIMIFAAGKDMNLNQAFYSADGDFLIAIQHGVLDIRTELGYVLARPNEIVVIPRGIRHRVSLPYGPVRGYILELYEGHFQLPELGPIGSNGLADCRDFQEPVAYFENMADKTCESREANEDANQAAPLYSVIAKFDGKLFQARQNHTPFDVVA